MCDFLSRTYVLKLITGAQWETCTALDVTHLENTLKRQLYKYQESTLFLYTKSSKLFIGIYKKKSLSFKGCRDFTLSPGIDNEGIEDSAHYSFKINYVIYRH